MENSKINSLPIFKHLNASEIGDSVDKFRKGEKGMFNIFKLLLLGAVGYFSWIYVLPVVFQAIGQVLAVASTGIIIVALVLLAPVIFKGLRRFTRKAHEMVIRHDPFGELDDQKDKMIANKTLFQKAKGKIYKLKTDMEANAAESQDTAEALQKRVIAKHTKGKKLKAKLEELKKKYGARANSEDEYVNIYVEHQKVMSDANRDSMKYEQEKDFVQKYGSRGVVMKKLLQKLKLVEGTMDIKIADFDATIEILKKDYEFAKKAREATTTAKSAMLFTEGWEVEYALDVVTTSIAEDIAVTSGNLNDIDSITSMYAMDSDELWANLDSLANDINTGKDVVPDAKEYRGLDYKLSGDDKLKVGGFDQLEDNSMF